MSDLNLSSVSGKAVQAASFSRGAYDSKTPFVPPAGFEPLRVVLENPQSPDFAASAYVNPKTGELVVAYRGSDSTADLSAALKGAASGTWSGQFTDAAAYMKQAQGLAAEAVRVYSDAEGVGLSGRPQITTLTTGHSLGGMLAQVVAKMYGVEAQVQDAPGAARLIDTPQFKQSAVDNGQPESGHDITGKVQNVTTSNIAKLGEQFQETQVVAIPALGQMGGLDALATVGAFLANPVAGVATGEALQTVAEHSSVKIEDALHMLAGIKSQVADAGVLSLQPMYLDRDGKPVPYAPASQGDASNNSWQIQALVDKNGKVVAFFDREVVDGEMQPVAVVVESGNRIHLTHAQDESSPQVIETNISGERRVVSQSELLRSLQDARGTPENTIYSADAVNGMDLQSDQFHKAQENTQQSETNKSNAATQQVVDAFNNPKVPTDQGVQIADASGDLPDTSAHTNSNTLNNYLDTQGNALSPAQQNTLATQIDKLGLGGEGDLSFYSLPSGGALIANADGDIVGEIHRSNSGGLNLKAHAIDANGNTVEVNQHINSQGESLNQAQYNAQAQAQANASVNLFNSLMAAQQWDQLDDMGKLAVLVNVYSATDTLGGNLPGDLGGLASVLSLMQGLESGNDLLVLRSSLQLGQMGLDAYSDYMTDLATQMADDLMASSAVDAASSAAMDAAAEAALESAAASNAAGSTVPYVSYVIAIQNFEDHPEQSAGTVIGTYIGQALGAEFGPIGSAIGGAIGGFIGGTIGGMFGGGGPPPPPVGVASFSWDTEGNIQHTVDFDQSGGGSSANNLAASVQGLLAHVVQAINAQNPSTADDVAINPYRIPSVGCDRSGSWLEITLTDGSTLRENITSETIATRLIELLQNNGGLAPAWQVQTEQVKWQHAHEQVQELNAQRDGLLTTTEVDTDGGTQTVQVIRPGQEARYAELGTHIAQAQHRLSELPAEFKAGLGDPAVAGDQAYTLQGNAAESADFKSQIFDALIVHVAQHAGVQASVQELNNAVVKTSEILRDADNDGYLEKTQWVSATDAQGNLQGLLTIDFNGNGQIETRDILNLGGNADTLANQTDEAKLATQNVAQQRNNVEWLDANGDGTLDKSDPAFAAIKLWIDANQDGQMQAGEGKSVAALHISSINFRTGDITYADGHRHALTATTLKADTEGVKLTQIAQVNPDGTLHTLDAGTVLEHEGYQGKVQITDEGGTRWASERDQTYEQQAKRTGDWEGTAEQDAHRHGGGNVAEAPTETNATGATDFGPVRAQANQRTQSIVTAGDGRVVSDAHTQAPTPQINAQTTIAVGDSRIKSNAATPNTTNNNVTNKTPCPADNRIAFVPTSQTSVQNEIRVVTDSMIESSQSLLFGGGSASLGVLAAVGAGVTASAASAAEAAQRSVVVSEVRSSDANSAAHVVVNTISSSPTFSSTASATSTDTSPPSVTFRQVDLGVFNVPQVVPSAPASTSNTGETPTVNPIQTQAANTTFVQATVMVSAPAPLATSKASAPASGIPAPQATPDKAMQAAASAAPNAPSLNYPVVQAEALPGSEDVVLRLTQSVLLANDRTSNASADPSQPALTITAVSQPLNGQVSLVNGEVFFAPDLDFHGTASFTYTVTDQYGLSTKSTATLEVAAVNDAPVTQGELVGSDEDIGLIFTQTQLLANDGDVDVAIDGQVLSISRVGDGQHGTVTLDAQGQVRFVPDLNYHGPAQFTYWVSDGLALDGAGAEVPATVNLTIAAVNDVPVVQGEEVAMNEDIPLLIPAATLLANDSDVDTATDGQVSSISTVNTIAGQTHGTVSLVTQADGTQQVQFTPDLNYHGVATFNYTVSDGNGGFTTAIATVNIAAVNDAPVTQSESYASDEDISLIFTQAQLLRNDSDVDVATDGQVLSISRVGQAEHGTVWLDAQGNLRFVPDANYHGPAKFTYWVSDGAAADGAGIETPATMSMIIAAVNDIPVVQGESANTTEDTTLSIDAATLLANDSDVDTTTDSQVLSISAVSNAAHCTVSLVTHADGTQRITFVPDANYHGAATFDYTVSDGNGGTAVAAAVVNLSAVNDAPVTTGEIATGDEDTPLVFTSHDLLANDSDVDVTTDSQVLTISRVSGATHGTVSLDAQGQVHFTPDANYHGSAQFTYWVSDSLAADGAGAETPATVSITILAVNDLPMVTGETLNNRQEDVSLLFNPVILLANDADVDTATDGQVLTITNISNAQHGTLAWAAQPDGSQYIAFTPEANYFGVASYQYTVSDGNGGNTVGTVVVNLAEVNDTPVAADDSLSSTAEDTALHISFASLLGNDTDADSHNSQWGGADDVLTVSVVGNATHGAVAIVNGEVVFTPDANYHGPASFAYQVTDGSGAVSQALATFSVTALNDAPLAVGETISSNEDTTLVISQAALLQNDSDVDVATDGQTLSITAVSNAQYGTVTLNTNGTISFVPGVNYYGNASFDYTVSDGNGGATTTTATIGLANVNDAPVATGETVSSNEDQVLTIIASALLQNDSDIDNARADMSISRVQSGAGGTVSLNASGNVVFSPTLNYNGNATFTYWVKDLSGLESNAVTTTVVLAAVNDAPTVQGEIVTGASEDTTFYIDKSTLLTNDHDTDDPYSALRLSWVGNASNGEVSLDANGNVVYKFIQNFNGNATFEYKVRDAAGFESPVVQAVIPVAAVNDKPVAVDDRFTTYKNSTLTVAFSELTSNDKDVDRDALTVSTVRDHANGHASIVNGQVQFVATTGFTGAASFDYLTDDAHGGQVWATAFVDVKTPPNQYPAPSFSNAGIETTDNTWRHLVSGFFDYVLQDENPATVQITFYSAKGNLDGNDPESFSQSQVGAVVDAGNHRLSWNIRPAGYSYIDYLEVTWRLVDGQGLENYFTWQMDGMNPAGPNIWNFTTKYSGYYAPPVILDLNGDGVHFTSLQNSNVTMDVNFDGIKDKMAWAGNDDGVLVWDKDQNHQITDASEFGFQTLKAGAQTDLEGLQALDTNGNGLLDAGDAKFAEFAVWQDANGNGETDAGEFKTLTELGITNITLHSDGQVRDAGTLLASSGSGETDATVMGNATFTRTDGSTGVVADTMLAYEAGHATQAAEVSANAALQVIDTSAADTQRAEIIRQALLFNQVCNTAVAIDRTPLGFVPIEPDVQLHDMLVAPQDGSHQLAHSA